MSSKIGHQSFGLLGMRLPNKFPEAAFLLLYRLMTLSTCTAVHAPSLTRYTTTACGVNMCMMRVLLSHLMGLGDRYVRRGDR